MLLSVIIPTCHRADLLARCLELLQAERQGFDAALYEIIVTDDSRNDVSKHMVAARFPSVKWIAGPRRGPAANRNHGAHGATGDWLAFVDDDCEPDARWLKSLADAVAPGDADVIEGKTVCPDKKDDPFQEQVENLNGGVFWSCNLAMRREVFERMGGFDEDFAEAGGEDMELAWRIRQRGLLARFVPEALVAHPARRLTWRKLWWRTLLSRWMLLYWMKTAQAPALDAAPPRIVSQLVARLLLNLARTTLHLVTRFDPASWRTRLFFQLWNALTFPVLLPYLLVWEFRFRAKLISRPPANRFVPAVQLGK